MVSVARIAIVHWLLHGFSEGEGARRIRSLSRTVLRACRLQIARPVIHRSLPCPTLQNHVRRCRPFTHESAVRKARLAEDAWNSRDPQRVALAYTLDSVWRNRAEFPVGRAQIQAFLERKWARELDYRLIKELWALRRPPHRRALCLRMARRRRPVVPLAWQRELGVRFDHGLMQRRFASINDKPIAASERKFHWPQGRRPDEHPGLSELGL